MSSSVASYWPKHVRCPCATHHPDHKATHTPEPLDSPTPGCGINSRATCSNEQCTMHKGERHHGWNLMDTHLSVHFFRLSISIGTASDLSIKRAALAHTVCKSWPSPEYKVAGKLSPLRLRPPVSRCLRDFYVFKCSFP